MKNAEACRVWCWYLRAQKETDRQRQMMEKGPKESFGRDDVPLSSHLSGVEGHDGVWRLAIIDSFASLPLSLLLPAVHLHHLFLLLWMDCHLASIGGLGHLATDFSTHIWRKYKHKHIVLKKGTKSKFFLHWWNYFISLNGSRHLQTKYYNVTRSVIQTSCYCNWNQGSFICHFTIAQTMQVIVPYTGKSAFHGGVQRLSWGMSQPEERRCPAVWWYCSKCFCIACQTAGSPSSGWGGYCLHLLFGISTSTSSHQYHGCLSRYQWWSHSLKSSLWH